MKQLQSGCTTYIPLRRRGSKQSGIYLEVSWLLESRIEYPVDVFLFFFCFLSEIYLLYIIYSRHVPTSSTQLYRRTSLRYLHVIFTIYSTIQYSTPVCTSTTILYASRIQLPPPCGLGHIHFYCIYHMVPYHTWDLTLSRYIHLHHHKYCHAVTSQVFIKMTNSSNNKYIYTIHGKVGFSDMVRLILSTDIYSMYMIAKCPIYQRGYFTL